MAQDRPETEPTPVRHRTPRWKIALILLLLALCVVGSVYFHQNLFRPAQELAALLEETDRNEPGWRLADMLADYRLPPDDRNGALVVLKAHSWLKTPYYDRSWVGDRQISELLARLEPCRQLTPEEFQVFSTIAEKEAEALNEALKIVDMPQGRFPIHLSPDPRDMTAIRLESYKARDICDLFLNEFLVRLQGRDDAGVWQALTALDHLANYLDNSPLLIDRIQERSIIAKLIWALERLLACSEPHEEQLKAFQERLAAREGLYDLLTDLRLERADTDATLEALQTGRLSPASFYGIRRWRGGDVEGMVEAVGNTIQLQYKMFQQSPTRIRRDALLYYNDLLKIMELRPKEAWEAWDEYLRGPGKAASDTLSMVGLHRPRLFQIMLAHSARHRCAVVGLAVERFRLKHGRWPQSLDELRPEFLATIPTSPVTGEPLKYEIGEDGVVIWCPDPESRLSTLADFGHLFTTPLEGKGIGFRLWHVDRRNQPPLPKPEPGIPGYPERPNSP